LSCREERPEHYNRRVSEHPDILARLAAHGARLREVRPDLLRQTADLRQRWFQGPEGCDLFLWYDAVKGLSQVQLTLGHAAVEWALGRPVRTARLEAFGPLRHASDKARLVHDRDCDQATLAEARALLSQASVDEVTLALVRRHLGLQSG
jgi:hypothetical protein